MRNVNGALLDAKIAAARAVVPEEILAEVRAFLREAHDAELVNINPFRFAARRFAARVQGLSDGRDVMASDAIFRECGAAEYLAARGWAEESFVTSLKGLRASHQVHKLTSPGTRP